MMRPFDLSPADLFNERSVQFRAWGIPPALIKRAQAKIHDCWASGPGGWCHEWESLALDAEKAEKWLLASALHAAARFPVPITDDRKAAMLRQIACYERAAVKFPVPFERKTISVPYRTGHSTVTTHIFNPRRASNAAICLSAGVDTQKMEIHRLALALAVGGNFTVAVIDMPGTGESKIPLAPDADAIYAGVIDHLRSFYGASKVGVVALSFGGMWAAKLSMLGAVDAAVDIGGPVCASPLDGVFISRLPNGMPGIIANAMGLSEVPSVTEFDHLLSGFMDEMRPLLARRQSSSLLVFNGDADPYIPRQEIEVFRDFPNADVWMFKNATHCAPEILPRAIPSVVGWLSEHLQQKTLRSMILRGLGGLLLRRDFT